jgi:hypothetical protein
MLGKKAASLGLHDLDLDAIAHAAGDPGHSGSRASLGLSSSPRKRSGRAHSPSGFAREGRVVGWEEKNAETEVDRRLRQMQREDEEEFTRMYGSLDPWQHPELINNEPTLLLDHNNHGGGGGGGGAHSSSYRFGGRVGPKKNKRKKGKSAKRADELFERSKQNPYSPYFYEREELTGGTFASHQSAQRTRLEDHQRQEARLSSTGRALQSTSSQFVNTGSSVHDIAHGSPIKDRRGRHHGAILNDVSTDEEEDSGFTRGNMGMNGGMGPLSDDQIEQLLSELSARLNKKLMLLIRGELRSEEKRHALLASLTDARDRAHAEEGFRKERLVANRRIEQVTAQNETIISQKMEELGIPRPRE